MVAEQETKLLKSLQEDRIRFDEIRADVQETFGARPQILEMHLAHIDRMEKIALEGALSAFGAFSNNIKNITNRSINNIF